MFNPSRGEVREMFFGAWRKYREGVPLAGMEAAALDVILLHPEYHAVLETPGRYRDRDYTDEANPFLHMSLHLAPAEPRSPHPPAPTTHPPAAPPGPPAGCRAVLAMFQARHEALHQALECLAETLWRAQRDGAPPE